MNTSELKIFSSEGLNFYKKNIPFDAVSRKKTGEKAIIGIGSYETPDHLLRSLKTATRLPHFGDQYNKINWIFLFFGRNEGITFPNNESPSILDFNGFHDCSGYHIGYKILDTFENLIMADDEEKMLLVIIFLICLQWSNSFFTLTKLSIKT